MQPILSITVPVKKIRGAARHCYGDCDGAIRREQTVKPLADPGFPRAGAPTQGGGGGELGGCAILLFDQKLSRGVGSSAERSNVSM